MTEKKRVLVNVIATYGRSLFAIACGLFTGRWLLMSLGEVDYGLYGVVGGLTGFIGFINGLMADAVGRFYAFSVGQAKVEGGEGIEICRKWFNTALVIHSVIPAILIVIGYPLGVWAVRNWLTIPPDRVEACIWVFRCVCVTCFVGMINVPYRAMYTAKQYIAELTIYSVVQTASNVVFLYYMVSHPGVWLTRYAVWACILYTLPQAIICLRAVIVFEECRFRSGYLFDLGRFRELFVFAAYRFGGAFCSILSHQGMSLLVNKMLGPARNAAMTVANVVSGHSNTFSGSLTAALYPVITNACGAGEYEKMRKWSYAACKFSTVFVLVFALPLFVEISEVMTLWLKNPPAGAPMLCVCLLIALVFEDITSGHYMAIFSVGQIRGYQICCAIAGLLALPFSYLCIKCGLQLLGVGVGLVLASLVVVGVRLYFGRTVATLSAWHWMRSILLPLALCAAVGMMPGVVTTWFLPPSFGRVVITTGAIELVFLPLVWFFVFGEDEKRYVQQRFKKGKAK